MSVSVGGIIKRSGASHLVPPLPASASPPGSPSAQRGGGSFSPSVRFELTCAGATARYFTRRWLSLLGWLLCCFAWYLALRFDVGGAGAGEEGGGGASRALGVPWRGRGGVGSPAAAPAPVDKCASVTTAYVEARLVGAVRRRTRPCHQTHVGGSPFTPSTVLRVHPCVRPFSPATRLPQADRMLFVVMTGLREIVRIFAVRETWGTLVPPQNILAVGEANHSATGMVTFDEVIPHETDPNPAKAYRLVGMHSYHDAQHRTLFGLRYGARAPQWRGCDWIILVDDDTYVNVHELPGFLVGWDHRLPLLFGHIWYGPEMRGKDEGAWPSGGAGIILSRRAAEMLAANLYTKLCPFLGLNDVTLGHCATRLGIPMVRCCCPAP